MHKFAMGTPDEGYEVRRTGSHLRYLLPHMEAEPLGLGCLEGDGTVHWAHFWG
jgi:hypothetical protein